jgi:uncharacterized repeat protein (TIGR03843 family)
MEIHGRIAGSSNATLLVTCRLGEVALDGIYKPVRGERPLWDFPPGLHHREVAAYELSSLLGWDLVPETVEREDAPFGPGSVQRFVEEDGVSHYFTLREDPAWHPTLVTLAAFDVVVNNADRKSGHVLLAEDRLWAIDNGLCFSCEPKLRTVIWDFAGEPLPDRVQDDLARLFDRERARVVEALSGLLDRGEVAGVIERASALLDAGALPVPDDDGHWPPYPWPLV